MLKNSIIPIPTSKRFLILKSNIKEKVEDIKHQFFRRERFKPILRMCLEYLTILEIIILLKLNKNMSKTVLENKLVKKIPELKKNFENHKRKILRYYDFTKLFTMDLDSNLEEDVTNITKLIIPIYFYKNNIQGKQFIDLQMLSWEIGSLGGELLAYLLKKSEENEMRFKNTKNLDNIFKSIYFPECDDLILLEIFDCSWKNSIQFKFISELKNLKEIHIEKCYSVDYYVLVSICDGVIENELKLETLKLISCGLRDGSMNSIANLIRNVPSLIRLDLSQNHINETGLIKLAEAIDYNSNLEILNLGKNRIKDSQAEDFFLALYKSRPKSLKILNLSENIIAKKGIKMFGKVIKRKDCKLVSIDLSGNQIEQNDLFKFLGKIRSTSKLKRLNFKSLPLFSNYINEIREINENINTKYNLNINLTLDDY